MQRALDVRRRCIPNARIRTDCGTLSEPKVTLLWVLFLDKREVDKREVEVRQKGSRQKGSRSRQKGSRSHLCAILCAQLDIDKREVEVSRRGAGDALVVCITMTRRRSRRKVLAPQRYHLLKLGGIPEYRRNNAR
jgi:hypothetical protein